MCRRLTFTVSGDVCVCVAVMLTKCAHGCTWVCVSGSDPDPAVVAALAETLKVNTSVQKISLYSEWCL